jgi:hypothetical protein
MLQLSKKDLINLKYFVAHPTKGCDRAGECNTEQCIIKKLVVENNIILCRKYLRVRAKRAEYAKLLLNIHEKLKRITNAKAVKK